MYLVDADDVYHNAEIIQYIVSQQTENFSHLIQVPVNTFVTYEFDEVDDDAVLAQFV